MPKICSQLEMRAKKLLAWVNQVDPAAASKTTVGADPTT
jgi:hypothetical protein